MVTGDWSTMTWREIKAAASEDRVVIVPMGCVETQGPHTPIGLEFQLADRLAKDVAARTEALAVPAIPFGNSGIFRGIPGTILVRPRVLVEVYKDVLLSVCRAGFRRILCIATHIPNQPLLEEAASEVRAETGRRVVWVNPGALAATYLRDLFEDPVAVRGHGAEPGISLARYLYGTEVPDDSGTGERGPETYGGFDVLGPALEYRGFPIGMSYSWEELYPESGGYGDASRGTVDIGRQLYERLIEHVSGVVETIKKMDTASA